jgi:hypothetical protein
VSKDAEKCKESEFVELLLYFQLRIEKKTLKNCWKIAKHP